MARVPNGQIGQWIRFIASAILIPSVVAMLVWIIAIERRLTAIEANRFTSADGAAMIELIGTKADKVNVPPPEVRIQFEFIASEIRDIKAALRRLEDRKE